MYKNIPWVVPLSRIFILWVARVRVTLIHQPSPVRFIFLLATFICLALSYPTSCVKIALRSNINKKRMKAIKFCTEIETAFSLQVDLLLKMTFNKVWENNWDLIGQLLLWSCCKHNNLPRLRWVFSRNTKTVKLGGACPKMAKAFKPINVW